MRTDTLDRASSELPSLDGSEVHVWRVELADCSGSAGWVDLALRLLSADEQERAAGHAHLERARQFVAGRVALRQLLSGYLTLKPSEIALDTVAGGKPCLTGAQADSGISFNLSHSRDAAVYAFVRQRRLGIDLEFMRPEINAERIARRFFTPPEIRQLMAVRVAERTAAFYACWTRKEAYLKASGVGLTGGLRRFSVNLEVGSSAPLLAADDKTEVERWRLLPLDMWPCYAAALCVEGCGWRVRVSDWDARTATASALFGI